MANPAKKGKTTPASPDAKTSGDPVKKDATPATPDTGTIEVARDDSHARKSAVRDIVGSEPAHHSGANFRRANVAAQLFGISILVTLGTACVLFYWMGTKIEKSIAAALSHAPSGTTASATPSPASTPSAPGDAAALAEARQQITALQQQLDSWRRDQLLSQKELRESIERVSAAAANAAQQPSKPMPISLLDGAGTAGIGTTAEMVPQITPTQQEFIMLKERNRITAYADEAIATAARKPLETLVEYLRDSGSAHLHDAVQTEYMRVVRMIQFYQREDPSYRLPVAELFKDSQENTPRSEADLTPAQLHQLLIDHAKYPLEARVRAAMLLKSSTDAQTDAKLLEAMRSDPSLEVAKHAQITFEQRVQRRFRLFDLPAVDAWLQSQQAEQKKPDAPLK